MQTQMKIRVGFKTSCTEDRQNLVEWPRLIFSASSFERLVQQRSLSTRTISETALHLAELSAVLHEAETADDEDRERNDGCKVWKKVLARVRATIANQDTPNCQ